MGLSRPGVESTLFRARKRLTEEYDELVSGQRCTRIQSIIAAAGGTAPGTRDARRLARHVSHCQPCRRMAMAAGLDISSLPRTPVRRAIERVAGFLPLPAFLRARFFASEQMVPVSEPMAAAWSKAVAAGAALLVAGVGAGVAPHGGGTPPALKPDRAKPAAAHTRSADASSSTRVRRPLAVAPRKQAVVKSKSRTGGKHSASLGKSQRSSTPSSTSTPSAGAPTTSAPKPAATNPTRSAPSPTRGVHAPTGGGTTTTTPSLPKVTLPSINTPVGSTQVGGAVEKAVNDAGAVVNQATGDVQDTVDGVTGGLLTP
jgi:hypothetical protein